jgi:RNA polymerase sigma factor (sigma-70 family)
MTAQEIINQWNSMTDEDKFIFCQNCVKREIKMGRKLRVGIEFDDAVQGTAEGVLQVLANPTKLDADTERRESQGKAGNTLAAVVCRAAHATVERMAYHDAKDSKATNRTITSEDGDEIDVLDTTAAAEDTEASAIFRATLQQFMKGLDEINQNILTGRIQGMTEREISQIVGISNVAVHNRLAKMQKTLAAMLN